MSYCSYVVPVKFILPGLCLQHFFFFFFFPIRKHALFWYEKIGIFIEGNLRCCLFVICNEFFWFCSSKPYVINSKLVALSQFM